MRFIPTAIEGAFVIETERMEDERGAFARTYCRDAFLAAGVRFVPVQCSLSINPVRGTLRGMHYQRPPHGEAKLVTCVAGRVFDVAIDLRRSSPSFGQAVSCELAALDSRSFFIPAGCAHGFLTLVPDSSLSYFIDVSFQPGAGAGLRWNDPAFAIDWPGEPRMISDRDATYFDFDPSTPFFP